MIDTKPTKIDYFVEQLAEAFSRIEFDIQSLHKGQNNWQFDPTDGMYEFKGYMDPFFVKKHSIDLIREVWHIYDGVLQLMNAKWAIGQIKVTDTSLDKGKGPGRAIVDKHVESCRWTQLAGDLCNLTKHYRLERATKTGDAPPVIGDSILKGVMSGKLDMDRRPDGSRIIKLERPVPFRPTLVVLDESGQSIGDIVEIAIKARDSWIAFLAGLQVTFSKAN